VLPKFDTHVWHKMLAIFKKYLKNILVKKIKIGICLRNEKFPFLSVQLV
jgi:hypothetical protein